MEAWPRGVCPTPWVATGLAEPWGQQGAAGPGGAMNSGSDGRGLVLLRHPWELPEIIRRIA